MSRYLSQAIEDLIRLIRIESVKSAPAERAPFGSEIRAALDEIFSIARKLGFDPVDVDGYAGYLDYGPDAGETVGVLAHLDVVPIGDGWTRGQGERAEGKIFGRGAADDKGPAVACLYALKSLADTGYSPRRRIRLIFGCDEESGSRCMDEFAAKVGMPEIGFSPDSDFPLIVFEKTILQVRAQIPLPSGVFSWNAGTRPNVVPDRSELRTSFPIDGAVREPKGYRSIARGRAAHAMAPETGESAVRKHAETLRGKTDSAAFEKFLSLCSPDALRLLGLDREDPETGEPTVNLGMLRTDEKTLCATFDFRLPACLGADDAIEALGRYLGTEVEILQHAPCLRANPDGELVRTLYRVFVKRTGKELPLIVSGGGTYARHMPNGVAFGPYLPGEDNKIHDRDEFLREEHLDFLIDIYADAMRELSE